MQPSVLAGPGALLDKKCVSEILQKLFHFLNFEASSALKLNFGKQTDRIHCVSQKVSIKQIS